ncbi:MAG: NAD(P)-dependent oxidoreductase [Dehalococcoidia bacterium]
MQVGFIGLGNMGRGMARNLIKNGADLTVYTRTRSKVDEMVAEGAKAGDSNADVAEKCDIVLTCLPDVKTSREVFLGENGIVSKARPGQVLVDHSTVDVATSKACAEAAQERGAIFLDAPISGGPGGAADGSLAIMVGGDKGAFEKARPTFEMMGANIRHMGPTGAGTAMKLINQLLVGVNTTAAAEAFALANSAGVDINQAVEVLQVSWGQSRMVERSGPITASRAFEDSAAPVRNLSKDLGIIRNLAQDSGLALTLTLESAAIFDELMQKGMPDGDIAAALLIIEERSKK